MALTDTDASATLTLTLTLTPLTLLTLTPLALTPMPQRTILMHGRLFISHEHLCFASNVFGVRTLLVLPFREVSCRKPPALTVIVIIVTVTVPLPLTLNPTLTRWRA